MKGLLITKPGQMQFPGRLSKTTLGDLLGQLHRARATGALELVETAGATAGRVHRIFVEAGLVRDVQTHYPVIRLGELLHQEGFLERAILHWLARRISETPERLAGEILILEGKMKPEVIRAALRRQLRLKLEALFKLTDASVRFRVALRRAASGERLPLSPREFLHGRSRHRDGRAGPETPPKASSRLRFKRQDPVRARALATLGLGPDAGRIEVRQAFRRLAADIHPDRHPDATAGERAHLVQRFAELSAAYHRLVA